MYRQKLLGTALLFLSFLLINEAQSQELIPYSFSQYQKLSNTLYSRETRLHTSLKPFLGDSILSRRIDSLSMMRTEKSFTTWLGRKLFTEHLVDVRKADYSAYVDFLPDFQVGRDIAGKQSTWLNTRGFQAGGTIGKSFSFYTSGFENQGQFAKYYTNYATENRVVPGQSFNRNYGFNAGKTSLDWSYVTALISYTPIKYLNITAGYDKNFIGDGYRSMLLSDFSSAFPFLRLTGTLGNVRYMSMWGAMEDPSAPQLSYEAGYRKKGGVFHYLDWNVNNRLSLGFFDAVIWAQTDDAGNRRGFDFGYANPIIFLRPVEASSGSPDNAVLGFSFKYKVSSQFVPYGQFILDEFEAKNFFSSAGSSRNKYGYQLGFRGAAIFNITNLNYLVEFNTAKPYTYTSRKPIINYAQYNEPLAHPFGANFRELVTRVDYSYRRWDFSGELLYSKYGLDGAGQNYGKDIFQPYTGATTLTGNYTSQGIRTDLYYAEGKAAYIINPRYNLRLELGVVLRKESNNLGTQNTSLFTFGLRSTFRNLYQDF